MTFVARLAQAALVSVVLAFSAVSAWAETGPPQVRWGEKIEVAAGAAHKGPWRQSASEYDYVDDPTVAIGTDDFVAVAWADQPRLDIFLQVYGPKGNKRFRQPVNISRDPETFSWLPRIVVAGDDASALYVLWQEIVFSGGSHGGEIFFARSRDGGRRFSKPINLSNSLAGDGKGRLTPERWHNGSLDLAMGPEGTLYAAWTEYEGTLWFSRSTDGGDSFSGPVRIAGGGNERPVRGPALAAGAGKTVHLAWTVGEDSAASIHFATSRDHGRSFGPAKTVGDSRGHADAPKIAVDGKGTVHLVFAESPTGPFERYHIRYTRRKDGEQTWDAPRDISNTQAEQFDSVGFPALSLDGADNLYVVWELFPNRRNYPRGLGLTLSADGGQSFASPSVVPGSADPALGFNGSQQGSLMRKLAVNEAGAVAVVSSTFNRGEASHIWLLRGQTAGR